MVVEEEVGPPCDTETLVRGALCVDQRNSVADDLRFWIDKLEEVQMSLVTVHLGISKCRAKTFKNCNMLKYMNNKNLIVK